VTRRWFGPAVAVFVLLALWQVAAQFDPTPARLIPGPADTLGAALKLSGSSTFWADLGISVGRMLLGFAVSTAIAVPLGVGLATITAMRASVQWLVDAMRYTPVSAFIPLLVLFLGVGEGQKVAVLALGTVPYTALITAAALAKVPKEIIDSARTHGVSDRVLLWRFYLPHAAPDVLVGLRISLALAWTYLLTAELVGANEGIGRFLIQAQRFLRSDEVLVCVIVVGAVGWASDMIMRFVQRRAFPWVSVRAELREAV
jgi:NitT/TauT family transport system permease protein